jgi:hypothetical protein
MYKYFWTDLCRSSVRVPTPRQIEQCEVKKLDLNHHLNLLSVHDHVNEHQALKNIDMFWLTARAGLVGIKNSSAKLESAS